MSSKFAYGPATWHVLASQGPPISPYHFYSTTYSTVHGRQRNGDTQNGSIRHKYVLNHYFKDATKYTDKLSIVLY